MKGRTNTARNWATLDQELAAIGERMRGVLIEERPAIDVIRELDDADVLIYLDPPYLPETRSGKRKLGEGYHTYGHEMSIADHVELLETVRESRSQIIISGYSAPLYDNMLRDWDTRAIDARSHCNSPRTERIWLNAAASWGLAQHELFNRVDARPKAFV